MFRIRQPVLVSAQNWFRLLFVAQSFFLCPLYFVLQIFSQSVYLYYL